MTPSPQANRNGPTDGFILTAEDIPASPLVFFRRGSFRGGAGDDGLTGVGAWNEYVDHVAVVGFTRSAASGSTNDFDVGTIFSDTPNLPNVAFISAASPGSMAQLTFTRSGTLGGTGNETPAAMGTINVLNKVFGLFYDEANLGPAPGGGVCVDHRARVHVVGATPSPGLTPTIAPFLPGRGLRGGQDAVRSMLDMLPPRVGRSDGTGTFGAPLIPAVGPIPGTTGATTPTCNLSPFGRLVGGAIPGLRRMTIDYEGTPPGVAVTPVLLVDRPPGNSTVIGTAVQINIPGSAPLDPFPVSLVELWPQPGMTVVLFFPPPGAPPSSFRATLPALPAPSGSFTVQVIQLLAANLPACGPGRTVFNVAGSPALTFDY